MNITVQDRRIATGVGPVFARQWTPDLADAPGPVILLFHDSLGCVELWREFPAQLAAAARRPVVAYDRIGFGQSGPHPGPQPLTFIRDEAVHVVPILLASFEIERILPAGHSVGGAMAVATAALWPERCAGVVTMAAQSFVEDLTRSGIRAAQADFERPGQMDRLARYHGSQTRWVLDSWTETWLSPAFDSWCMDDDLRALRCPLLALHGDRDEYGSPAQLERIGALAGGPARCVLLEQCGHFPHRQHPARVSEEVSRFAEAV